VRTDIVLFDIYTDKIGEFPEVECVREMWRGSVTEAQALYAEEPEILDGLYRLTTDWMNRKPTDRDMSTRIDLGAGGTMLLAIELRDEAPPCR
jgi:hypothetical protein